MCLAYVQLLFVCCFPVDIPNDRQSGHAAVLFAALTNASSRTKQVAENTLVLPHVACGAVEVHSGSQDAHFSFKCANNTTAEMWGWGYNCAAVPNAASICVKLKLTEAGEHIGRTPMIFFF